MKTKLAHWAAKVGRPSKYNPKAVKAICDAIADGVPNKFAAAMGGISHPTFCEWRRQFPEFSYLIDEAIAKGVSTRLRRIRKSGEKGNPKSDQWWLEHVFPEHFARNRVELSGPEPEKPIRMQMELSPPVTTEEVVPDAVIKNALRRYFELNQEEADTIFSG